MLEYDSLLVLLWYSIIRSLIAPLRLRIVLSQPTRYAESSTQHVRKVIKITGREIADEERTPSINVLLRITDLRWNLLGHILRIEERQTFRQVLLNCVKPAQESILGDLKCQRHKRLARDRTEGKR